MARLNPFSERTSISLDAVCYLPTSSVVTDPIGNQTIVRGYRPVFCSELPIHSAEFFNAGQQGIKPENLLVIMAEEYSSEDNVKYLDRELTIYKTYPRVDGFIELYCRRR